MKLKAKITHFDLQKHTFTTLFLILVVTLMLLPFTTTLNNILVSLVERTGWYQAIEDTFVPYIVRLVQVILRFLGFEITYGQAVFGVVYHGQTLNFQISWNCTGWQSLVILLVSLITGLAGNYTRLSKIECILFGILGTILLNLGRIVISVLAVVYVNWFFAFILHDYFMVLLTILWLFFFWWFSYSFILEQREDEIRSF